MSTKTIAHPTLRCPHCGDKKVSRTSNRPDIRKIKEKIEIQNKNII